MSSHTPDRNSYLDLARAAAKLSPDPDTKVGAVIVASDGGLFVGYNRFPSGVADTPERWQRPKKYQYVVTAETNAVANARGHDLKGASLYVTSCPCMLGAPSIVGAGIKNVYYDGKHSSKHAGASGDEATQLFKEAGVKLTAC
jgi:dCMP deaminase